MDQLTTALPTKVTRLFLGGVNNQVTVPSLNSHFSKYGPIVSCEIITHPGSFISKGYGFVSFMNREDAEKALLCPTDHVIDGVRLDVKESLARVKDNDKVNRIQTPCVKLHVENIPLDADVSEVKAFFSKFGRIEDIKLLGKSKIRPNGYGFIVFQDEAAIKPILAARRLMFRGLPLMISKCMTRAELKIRRQENKKAKRKVTSSTTGDNSELKIKTSDGSESEMLSIQESITTNNTNTLLSTKPQLTSLSLKDRRKLNIKTKIQPTSTAFYPEDYFENNSDHGTNDFADDKTEAYSEFPLEEYYDEYPQETWEDQSYENNQTNQHYSYNAIQCSEWNQQECEYTQSTNQDTYDEDYFYSTPERITQNSKHSNGTTNGFDPWQDSVTSSEQNKEQAERSWTPMMRAALPRSGTYQKLTSMPRFQPEGQFRNQYSQQPCGMGTSYVPYSIYDEPQQYVGQKGYRPLF